MGQSGGKLRFEDFTPLPCGDPNCATIGYLLKTPAGIRSVSEFIDFSAMQGFLHDKINYSLGDLSQCGCENEPLAEMLHAFELTEVGYFPAVYQAVHGCVDLGPGPDRPLLHACDPAGWAAGFLLPVLLGVRDGMKASAYPVLMLAGIIGGRHLLVAAGAEG